MVLKRSSSPVSRKEAILTRRQIEGMIADGHTIMIIDGKVLKVDAWLEYHPGGDKSIRHVVGRDATDEVTGYEKTDTILYLNEADRSFRVVFIR